MPNRTWFRLADVLPIAEHAMAGFTHRRTGIEARIDVPHGPALILTGSSVMDLLVSNGVSSLHRDNGSLQVAEAYTWRNTSGGSYDTTGIYDRPDLLAGVGLTECDRYRPNRDGFYPVGAFLWAWYPTDAAMPLTVRLRLTRTALLNRLRARHRRSR